jgi:carboxymethylenebutenolidase
VVVKDPATLTPKRPVAPIDLTANMTAPLLGLFGNDDMNPSRADVDKTEETLTRLGKTYEFHRYDGAGHNFLNWQGPGYRPQQAQDGWKKVLAFYGKNLATPSTGGAR